MKIRLLRYISLGAVLLGALMVSTIPALAEETNLIANSSAEVADSTGRPDAWTASKWGSNEASLQYKNEGRTGSKSLYVSMTSRSDGDAKWMHAPVSVTPNTSYTYTSWYKSNVATEIDMQYIAADGSLSYAYAATIAPSAEWVQLSATFVTPANVSRAVVMHIVADPGWLQTDDFVLAKTTQAPAPSDGSLIANGSMETANGAAPAGWGKNTWGDNTAQFSYESSGRTGSKSTKVTVTNYASGDAKWYAGHVPVTAGKKYAYTDYYKSNVATRVVASYISTQGEYTYEELAGAPASSSAWAQYKADFTIPAGAAKVSIYHVIDKVGNLTLDDVTLTEAGATAPTEPEPQVVTIANSSLETASGSVPANWQKNSWGSLTASHQYVSEGRTGSKSAKVTVTNYASGDAKWYFDPIKSLVPGGQYRFTAWYKTNAVPRVVAMFGMADGSTQYFGLPVAQPSGSTTQWQRYSQSFSVPAGAVSTSVFMLLAQNGWLQTDDYSIEPYKPEGFSRPLLTMTFDDGHEDNVTTALPLMNRYGLKSTQCYATTFIEGMPKAITDGVLAFYNSGHEICSHTVSHPMLTTQTDSQLMYELSHSKQYLERLIGQPVHNFASPYGDYDTRVVNEIKKYYSSHRSVDEGYNSKDNFDIYRLKVQNILSTTSAEEVAGWIRQAQADNTWLILVYHRVASDPGTYDSYTNVFEQHVKAIVDSGITVKTYQAALDEVTPQL